MEFTWSDLKRLRSTVYKDSIHIILYFICTYICISTSNFTCSELSGIGFYTKYLRFHLYMFPFQTSLGTITNVWGTYHYENTPIQIYRKSHLQKLKNFRQKKMIFFSYFCSKHRLWVLVRTAYVLSKNKKNNVYPYKPQFYYIKVGYKGAKLI